jgi:hypothetical protein
MKAKRNTIYSQEIQTNECSKEEHSYGYYSKAGC